MKRTSFLVIGILVVILLGAIGFIALERLDLMRWDDVSPSKGKFCIAALIQRGNLSTIQSMINDMDNRFPGNQAGDGCAVVRLQWWASGYVQFTRSLSDYPPADVLGFLKDKYGKQLDDIKVINEIAPTLGGGS